MHYGMPISTDAGDSYLSPGDPAYDEAFRLACDAMRDGVALTLARVEAD